MPSAEAALYNILTTGVGNPVAAIVGTRVYPNELPQNVIYPAIRYARISTPRGQYRTLDGFANYASPRMQLDCYATSHSAVVNLAQKVYQSLEGFHGTVSGLRIDTISTEDEAGELETEMLEGGADVPRQRLDVVIFHAE